MNLPIDISYDAILNIGLTGAIIVLGLFLITVSVGICAYIYYKKVHRYKQFKVIIWRKDPISGNVIEEVDDGGIFTDHGTEIKGLWLRKRKGVVLNPDRIPYLLSGKSKVIYLLKLGLKNYKYIKPCVAEGELKFNLGEEDINWGIFEYRNSHTLYNVERDWKQWVPFVGLFVLAFLLVFITIMVLKKFDVLAVVATKLDHAAMVLTNTV